MRDNIMPNDIVLHKPTGEKWVVAGISRDEGRLIPKGNPFPSSASVAECKLLERRYEFEPQDTEAIKYFMNHGMNTYVDVRSAVAQGWL